MTMGADPIAAAMLHSAAADGPRLDAFVMRKEAKAHGLQRRVEGPGIAGRRVLVVEDTSTTGGTPLMALEAVREAGAVPVAVATIADRDTGAGDKIEAQACPTCTRTPSGPRARLARRRRELRVVQLGVRAAGARAAARGRPARRCGRPP